jgi:hypothetical protein
MENFKNKKFIAHHNVDLNTGVAESSPSRDIVMGADKSLAFHICSTTKKKNFLDELKKLEQRSYTSSVWSWGGGNVYTKYNFSIP